MRRFRPELVVVALLASLVPACKRAPAANAGRQPVSGAVTLDGAPFAVPNTAFGRVFFHPDAAKGNTSTIVVTGLIDEHGRYQLNPDGSGAPPGWYRVSIVAANKFDPKNPSARRKSLLHARYGQPEASGLIVEVVTNPAPGAYDLRLKR